MDVCSVLFLSCLYICVCVCLQIQVPLRECRSIQSGVCGPPYYCAPLVCNWSASCVAALQTKNQKPARAGMPKRLGLLLTTLSDDFVFITAHLWSTITAIFPCVAKQCSLLRLILNYCQTPKRDLRFEFEYSYFEHLVTVILNPNVDFWYPTIVQSWFASIPSPARCDYDVHD